MSLVNTASILKIDSPNKADSIIVEAKHGIPYHVQKYIRENIDSKETEDLLKFIQNAYGGDSMIGKRDKKYTTGKNFYLRLKVRKTECPNFNDSQIKDIIRMANSREPLAIVKEICPELKSLPDQTGRAYWVGELINALGLEYLGPAAVYEELEDIQDSGQYVPPVKDETVISKINKACPNVSWSKHKLDAHKRNCVRVLKGNLSLMKYCLAINSFRNPQERRLFEAEFIRATYDQPDMIPQDINDCMMLAEEYVRSIQIKDMINLLDSKLKASLEGDEKGLNQAFAEQLKAKTTELVKCQQNIAALGGKLNGNRAKRKEADAKFNESIGRYIAACQDEQKRLDILTQKRAYESTAIKDEVEKIVNTDQSVGEIHGISIDEIFGFTHDITE